ncbi:Altronate dehydratase [hydrothermal vent metagenome]|uniref:Altronate dehydratase n=1 Tax=hydrothermal vent metagenome TaxID=652676 RepID=A0A3B0TFR2_9ZZZZ
MTATKTVRLHPDDPLVVAATSLSPGQEIAGEGVTVVRPIPSGHKMATQTIARGEKITKFGQFIGVATEDIGPGTHIHTHNTAMATPADDYQFSTDLRDMGRPAKGEAREFMGYHRKDGRVGTRNYIALCSTVNCSATVVRYIADEINRSGELEQYPNIDGVIALAHGTGCGMAGSGAGFENLERVIWGHATHPNVGAALFVGLGCEVMQIGYLREKYDLDDENRFQSLTIQGTGGTRKTIEKAAAQIRERLAGVNAAARAPAPASQLMVALQCGGSDGYSGITANPALGYAADLIVREGGAAVLAETTEIYGAEHLLTRRAVSREVGEKLIALIRWWEDYTARNGGEMDNNPSPGNKAGGLTNILEKSLGAAAKGGTSPLTGVYRYAEKVTRPGFAFMDSPGYDPASVTGQIASGCNIVCFTTGRGSAFGSKPAPTIKLATNSRMYEAMTEDMDINCGDIASGGATVHSKGEEIFEEILRVASGGQSKSEAMGLGDNEFVPWQIGAVM